MIAVCIVPDIPMAIAGASAYFRNDVDHRLADNEVKLAPIGIDAVVQDDLRRRVRIEIAVEVDLVAAPFPELLGRHLVLGFEPKPVSFWNFARGSPLPTCS